MKTLKAVALLGAMLAVAACTGGTGASGDATKGAATASGPTNDPAVRAVIDSANQKFAVAFKASDAATAASFYEQDATSMPHKAFAAQCLRVALNLPQRNGTKYRMHIKTPLTSDLILRPRWTSRSLGTLTQETLLVTPSIHPLKFPATL